MKPNLKFPFYAKVSLVFIGLFAFVYMLFIAQTIIVPIIYSTIMAILLIPIVNLFVRKGMNRALAIAITIILVISITILLIALLSSQMIQFGDSFPKLIENFHHLLNQSIAWTSENFNVSPHKINAWIAEKKVEVLSESSSFIGKTLINTGNVLVVLVLIPVYIFMILFYQPLLIEFVHKLFRSSNQKEINDILSATKKIIQSYLVGLILEAIIVAILNSVSLLILGIEYAILLGVIGAILNVIPYLGGIISVALSMMIALATKSPTYAFLVFGSYILIQLIDNNYIMPKIVASKVKINALVSIVVVLTGGALWGIPGMFLSIPLTAIIKVVFDHIEPLKPWGFLLGDTMPPIIEIRTPFKKIIEQIKNIK